MRDEELFLFEKLDVYQRSIKFVERITNLTMDFGRGNGYIIDQLHRAALSIPTNIAEGNGRYHSKERKNFFWIARGSAFECVPILELCYRKTLLPDEEYQFLRKELQDISKMLSGLIGRN